jgi:hypothetical protein
MRGFVIARAQVPLSVVGSANPQRRKFSRAADKEAIPLLWRGFDRPAGRCRAPSGPVNGL